MPQRRHLHVASTFARSAVFFSRTRLEVIAILSVYNTPDLATHDSYNIGKGDLVRPSNVSRLEFIFND